MKRMTSLIMAAGMCLTIAVSNLCGIVHDGKKLDELRESVLRMHVLANSDSDSDQKLKLLVRDALIERSSEIFGDAENFEQARDTAAENIVVIEKIAAEALLENGCNAEVSTKITDMYFDERVYGDITMPAGEYTAVRVEIGKAEGHNWWCVMYPPLCIPAACEEYADDDKETEDEFFSGDEKDILYHPQKFRVKFAVWEKLKDLFS